MKNICSAVNELVVIQQAREIERKGVFSSKAGWHLPYQIFPSHMRFSSSLCSMVLSQIKTSTSRIKNVNKICYRLSGRST